MVFSESSVDWFLNLLAKYIVPRLHNHIVSVVEDAVNNFINSTIVEEIEI